MSLLTVYFNFTCAYRYYKYTSLQVASTVTTSKEWNFLGPQDSWTPQAFWGLQLDSPTFPTLFCLLTIKESPCPNTNAFGYEDVPKTNAFGADLQNNVGNVGESSWRSKAVQSPQKA